MGRKDDAANWLIAYEEGYELEWSFDNFNWFNLVQEPSVGDNKYYRKKIPTAKEIIEEHQSDDPLPNGVA